MGTYNKGILGAFSGKVGPVVGASWRGIEVLRSTPKKTSREPTENQLAQREKFKAVTKFITPLKIIMSRYFGTDSGEQSRANRAMGYHLKEAVGRSCKNYLHQGADQQRRPDGIAGANREGRGRSSASVHLGR